MAWTTPSTAVVGQLLTASLWNAQVRDNLKAVAAVGSYQYVAALAGTAGAANAWQTAWLECNGAAVSRTTYADLFNYLNGLSTPLPFGTGDGSTTFNVPDLVGRTPVAMADAAGNATVKTIGNSDGVTKNNRRGTLHRHTPHSHTLPGNVVGNNGATWSFNGPSVPISVVPATNTADGGSGIANDPLDGGAYLVGGVWVIKALT